jgi:hypothetical protein
MASRFSTSITQSSSNHLHLFFCLIDLHLFTRIQVHPLVLKWQEFWLSLGDEDADFLDSEGAFDSFFEPLDDDDIL